MPQNNEVSNGTHFLRLCTNSYMKENSDPLRNRPSDEGAHNDPNIRDESALKPGTDTISGSDTDDVNNHLTRTASDGFREAPKDERADASFDEVGNKD